jgi:hypothetical protein
MHSTSVDAEISTQTVVSLEVSTMTSKVVETVETLEFGQKIAQTQELATDIQVISNFTLEYE